jgi:hypothetical protein
MPNGIQLSRRSSQLPVELRQKNSDLDVLITLAGDAVDAGHFGAASQVRVTRRVIRQNCSSYRPSNAEENSVLCGSGEKDGTPIRGNECFNCRAGQFSASGFFAGDLISITAAPPQSSVTA